MKPNQIAQLGLKRMPIIVVNKKIKSQIILLSQISR